MNKKENMNAKEAKKYLESLERKLDQLAVIQELTEKEVGRVQKAVGKKSRLPVEMDTAFGILLLIATAASAFYALIGGLPITGAAVGVPIAGTSNSSLPLSITALLLVAYLAFHHNKRKK